MPRLYLLLVFAMIVMASCAEESCVNVNSEKICVYVNSAEEICVNVNGAEEFCVDKCKALLAGGAVGAGVLAVGTAPVLVGFGSKGVVAGSMAASTQASIGNVVAGSWFAQTTSFAMSGAAAKTSLIGAGILASTTAAAAVADCFYTQENEGSFPSVNAVNPSSWLNAASSPFATGFGSGGVVAGSMAAATQASIGNVVAGSLFAQTTSFVMSGAAATVSWAGAGILGSTTAAAVADCLYTQENEGSFPADNAVTPSS